MERLGDPQAIMQGLLYVIALVLSITVHEFGHAWVANRLGDDLARSQGRVTLNPLAHIDPLGSVAIPLFGAITGMRVLGWGKPVFHALHPRFVPRWMTMRSARLFVSLAGPFMNLALAALLSLILIVLMRINQMQLAGLVQLLLQMNIGLAFFNLIPLPPLDGRSILFWFLPEEHPLVRFLEQWGIYIFFVLVMTRKLSVIMAPVYRLADLWINQLYRVGLGA